MPARPGGIDFAAALGAVWGDAGDAPLALMDERTDTVVAEVVELAVTRRSRRDGLLGRDSLAASGGMVLAPCFSIHTAFMRFPIDVAFVSRGGTVVKMVHELRAWRVAASLRAYAVVELPAGTLRRRDVATGDRLYFARRAVDAGPAPRDAGGEL